MGLKLNTASGGSVSIEPTNTASNYTLTVPAQTGTVALKETPAFSAYMSANQSISNATATKIAFDIEHFDTNSNYNNSTYRFTPTVAGYYQVQISCFFNISPTTGIDARLSLYKNGSAISRTYTSYASPTAYYQCTLSTLIYLNGSTDYIESYIYQGSGSSQNLGNSGTQPDNNFSASMVRAA